MLRDVAVSLSLLVYTKVTALLSDGCVELQDKYLKCLPAADDANRQLLEGVYCLLGDFLTAVLTTKRQYATPTTVVVGHFAPKLSSDSPLFVWEKLTYFERTLFSDEEEISKEDVDGILGYSDGSQQWFAEEIQLKISSLFPLLAANSSEKALFSFLTTVVERICSGDEELRCVFATKICWDLPAFPTVAIKAILHFLQSQLELAMDQSVLTATWIGKLCSTLSERKAKATFSKLLTAFFEQHRDYRSRKQELPSQIVSPDCLLAIERGLLLAGKLPIGDLSADLKAVYSSALVVLFVFSHLCETTDLLSIGKLALGQFLVVLPASDWYRSVAISAWWLLPAMLEFHLENKLNGLHFPSMVQLGWLLDGDVDCRLMNLADELLVVIDEHDKEDDELVTECKLTVLQYLLECVKPHGQKGAENQNDHQQLLVLIDHFVLHNLHLTSNSLERFCDIFLHLHKCSFASQLSLKCRQKVGSKLLNGALAPEPVTKEVALFLAKTPIFLPEKVPAFGCDILRALLAYERGDGWSGKQDFSVVATFVAAVDSEMRLVLLDGCSVDDFICVFPSLVDLLKSHSDVDTSAMVANELTKRLPLLASKSSLSSAVSIVRFCNALLRWVKATKKRGSSPDIISFSLTLLATVQLTTTAENHRQFYQLFAEIQTTLVELLKYHQSAVEEAAATIVSLVRRLIRALIRQLAITPTDDDDDGHQLMKQCCHRFNALCYHLGVNKKHFAMLSPYLVADYLSASREQSSVASELRCSLLPGVYRLLDLCDKHSIALLSVNLDAALQPQFKSLYHEYDSYFRYKG